MKHKRTKATEIPMKVKRVVWARDNSCCIFCGKHVPIYFANAHFIKRSQGGMGIEENIFTACQECHDEEDKGKNTNWYRLMAENYLRGKYKAWNIENLIYKKGRLKMKWVRSKYIFDNTDAIYCQDDNGVPEATLTVNLSDYGYTPPEGYVVIQKHKISNELYEEFKQKFVEKETGKVPYGYCEGILVKLKSNWKSLCRKEKQR